MKETIHRFFRQLPAWILLVPALLVVLLFASCLLIWNGYRNSLMTQQEEQLLLVTRTAGKNLETAFSQYWDDLEFLCRFYGQSENQKEIYNSYLDSNRSNAADICLMDESGQILHSMRGLTLKDPVLLLNPTEACSLVQYTGPDGHFYLGLRHQMAEDRLFCLIIDEEAFYTDLISDLRVGTNGYLLIKNSSGRIVMHPDREQWGIDVIEGRQQIFSGLDLDSLSEMVDKQIAEESGIYEYYSYWWTDPDVPRVKKISAHVHAPLGEDFFVVSAVVDYSDFYTPIAEGVSRLAFVFVVAWLVLLVLMLYIAKLLYDRRRSSHEIVYLRELNDTLEELHRHEESIAHQQRLQVMGAMTGGIAHEFNNFLTPILGFSELLMDELPPDSDSYDSAREIYDAADKAKDVVRQISAMSRKNVETVYRSLPARETLTHTLKMIESVCPPQVHLQQELNLTDEAFLGNRTQINQVLLNLCINAIHAIGAQEGILLIRAGSLTRQALQEQLPSEHIPESWDRYLQIDVVDTGCGMDPETLRHIFEPFFTTKKSGEGTGLGLSLADQIIRAHRGYLSVDSKPNEGSAFHLFLPILEKGAAAEPLEWGQSQKLQLVVADDNAKVLQMLKTCFEKLGLSLITCSKQEDLLRTLQETEPDVLAIDESLADGGGIEFCMSIQGKYPHTVKLLMVDRVTREVVEARRRGIIHGYLEKPVSDTTLLEAIRNTKRTMP